jgi:hypothetical protein
LYLGSRRASCRPPYGTAKCASVQLYQEYAYTRGRPHTDCQLSPNWFAPIQQGAGTSVAVQGWISGNSLDLHARAWCLDLDVDDESMCKHISCTLAEAFGWLCSALCQLCVYGTAVTLTGISHSCQGLCTSQGLLQSWQVLRSPGCPCTCKKPSSTSM